MRWKERKKIDIKKQKNLYKLYQYKKRIKIAHTQNNIKQYKIMYSKNNTFLLYNNIMKIIRFYFKII